LHYEHQEAVREVAAEFPLDLLEVSLVHSDLLNVRVNNAHFIPDLKETPGVLNGLEKGQSVEILSQSELLIIGAHLVKEFSLHYLIHLAYFGL
jgi:hypothetical protein